MLNLFQSNQMTALARVFCERNRGPEDPFAPMTAIVQSFGMGQWLKLQLAAHDGIAANVDCILPATFLWQLYRRLIPAAAAQVESPFERQRLTWRIMHLLKANPGISGAVSNYLGGTGDADLRRYQLAYELSLLFDEYLMYRPEWPLAWEGSQQRLDGHEDWQAELWRLILADLPEGSQLHRARLHQQTLTQLQGAATELPWQQLSVFGLSTMPPLQLQTFEALAAHIDIDIYFLNPSEHYWGDIVSEKDLARRSVRSLTGHDAPLADEDYLEVGNPLLASLGKQGREFFELLLESGAAHSDEYFAAQAGERVLDYVKNDILNLTHGGEFGFSQAPAKRTLSDQSLQIHVCHSRMREVEVLHDEILRAMQQHADLTPGDIMVMMPQVASYAPYIESVFNDSLPYRIADQSAAETGTLADVFLQLVNLPASRLTALEVLDLLETPAVMRRFDLYQEDLHTLSQWIADTGVRWELDGASKQERWALPADNPHTWRFGLQRLLTGFAMTEHQGTWHDILPYEISAQDAELVGRLAHVIDLLAHYRAALDEPRTTDAWQALLGSLLAEFFDPLGAESLELDQITRLLERFGDESDGGGYNDTVSHQLVAHWLQTALSDEAGSAGFLSGGITFATLVPMRSIPFRMICLLGMNDGEFPRDVRAHSFDLIAAGSPRKGDRSKRMDDRYLFLEALLSAEDIFYCSYIGRGIRDNKERPPSALVSELLDYLQSVLKSFEPRLHALQPFNQRYYRGNAEASYNRHWYTALNTRVSTRSENPVLPADPALACSAVSQLGQFLRHPAQYFLRERLGVSLKTEAEDLATSEPFELDDLEKHALADQALQAMARSADMAQFEQNIRCSGAVLPGAPGALQLQQQISRAERIYSTASEYIQPGATSLQGELVIGDHTLYMRADNLYDNQLVSIRAGQLNARQLLTIWVQHLGACALGKSVTSQSIHRQKDDAAVLTLVPIEVETATGHLAQLLDLFDLNLVQPVFLPATASRTLASNLEKGVEAALEHVRREWQRDTPTSEGRDREWQRLFSLPEAFDDEFIRHARQVWQPLLEASDDS